MIIEANTQDTEEDKKKEGIFPELLTKTGPPGNGDPVFLTGTLDGEDGIPMGTKDKRSVLEPKENRGSKHVPAIWNEPTKWNQKGIPTGNGTHSQPHRKRRQTRGRRGGRKKKKTKKLLGQGIFNLSHIQFTQEELEVLELGLKYAPDKPLDKFEAYIDLQKFLRKLNIKKYFAMNPGEVTRDSSDYTHTNLKNNSIFNPKTPRKPMH